MLTKCKNATKNFTNYQTLYSNPLVFFNISTQRRKKYLAEKRRLKVEHYCSPQKDLPDATIIILFIKLVDLNDNHVLRWWHIYGDKVLESEVWTKKLKFSFKPCTLQLANGTFCSRWLDLVLWIRERITYEYSLV